MALGTLCNGVVEVGHGLEDHAELGNEGPPQEGIGDDHPPHRWSAVTHFVADQLAVMFDELRQGTHYRALGGQVLQFVAMLEQEFHLEFGVRRIIFGMTRSEGFAVLAQGRRVDGKQDEEVIFAEGVDKRAFVEFEPHSDRGHCEPLLEGTCPRVNGLWCSACCLLCRGGSHGAVGMYRH